MSASQLNFEDGQELLASMRFMSKRCSDCANAFASGDFSGTVGILDEIKALSAFLTDQIHSRDLA